MFKITYKINFILSFNKAFQFCYKLSVLNANYQLLLDIAFYSIGQTITMHVNF